MSGRATITLKKYGLVVYTNFGVHKGFAGTTYGPLVFIRPVYKDDIGLLKHELVHTKQFWTLRLLTMSKLERELEAYAEQIKWYDEEVRKAKCWLFAGFIVTKYGIDGLSQQTVSNLLWERYRRG